MRGSWDMTRFPLWMKDHRSARRLSQAVRGRMRSAGSRPDDDPSDPYLILLIVARQQLDVDDFLPLRPASEIADQPRGDPGWPIGIYLVRGIGIGPDRVGSRRGAAEQIFLGAISLGHVLRHVAAHPRQLVAVHGALAIGLVD